MLSRDLVPGGSSTPARCPMTGRNIQATVKLCAQRIVSSSFLLYDSLAPSVTVKHVRTALLAQISSLALLALRVPFGSPYLSRVATITLISIDKDASIVPVAMIADATDPSADGFSGVSQA